MLKDYKNKLQKLLVIFSIVGFSISQTWAEDLKDIYELALINDQHLKLQRLPLEQAKNTRCKEEQGYCPRSVFLVQLD